MILRRGFQRPFALLSLAAIAVAATLLLVSGSNAAPTVSTDRPDYHPSETVVITGGGFASGTYYDIPVVRPDGSMVTGNGTMTLGWDTVVSNGSGAFTYNYKLDGIVGTYQVRVYPIGWNGNLTEGPLASVTFTDAPLVSDFKQCAENEPSGPVTGLGNCHWIGSIVQSSNASYFEGMSVPQRILFTNVTATTLPTVDAHSLEFSHQATKGGVHAYDFLTSWDQAVAAAASIPPSPIPLSLNPCGVEIGPPGSLAATCASLLPASRSGTNTNCADVTVPDDTYLDGGTEPTLQRIDAYENLPSGPFGNRTIKICALSSASVISSASFDPLIHSGPDTGDSDILYKLKWTSDSAAIYIEMAGHLAVSGTSGVGSTAWGLDQGSSQIAGGPYHFNLSKLDGASLGSQDNQIKGADIAPKPGQITIVKDSVPNDPQGFCFSGGLGAFCLDDDGTATLPSNTHGPVTLAAGSYIVTETTVAGWALTGIVCVTDQPTGDTTVVASPSVTIDLDANENITCTFTNTGQASITIQKVCNPAGDLQLFSFTKSYAPTPVSVGCGGSNASGTLSPGTYTVSETVPAGWTLTSATCSDGSILPSVVLTAGENVTCTFTNTKASSITIVKDTVPNDPLDFCFNGDLPNANGTDPGDFCLDDDGNATPLSNTHGPVTLPAGSYMVNEIGPLPAGVTLTGIGCSGDLDSQSVDDLLNLKVTIDLDAGENITCTFTNAVSGTIKIVKDSDPDDPQDFSFSGGLGAFLLDDDGNGSLPSMQSFNVSPGSYAVTEAAVGGWVSPPVISCIGDTDGQSVIASPTVTIDLDAGESITCTFKNTKQGTIIVEKQTDPNGAAGSFTFTGTAAGTISDNGQIIVANLTPGVYTSKETDPAPTFLLTSIVCNDSNSSGAGFTATFNLDPGEIVKCTFTNTKQPTLTVNKLLIPASDLGQVNLRIDGATQAACVGNGGTTGAVIVSVGGHTVDETACLGTNLSDYVTAISGDCAANGAVTLAAGDNKTCTITNSRKGKIIVKKETDPNAAPGSFTFTGDAAGTISDGGMIMVDVTPGTYSSMESDPTPAFDLTSVVCDDTDSTGSVSGRTATFVVAPGETVTCTFTNTQRGTITIVKDAVPDDTLQDFAFSCSGPTAISGFTLDDDTGPPFSNMATHTYLVPGTYNCSENGPPGGWVLTSIVCVDPSGGTTTASTPVFSPGPGTASIALAPGETVTCTFVNQKLAKIIIDKVTNPSADTQTFGFTVTGTTPCSPPLLADTSAPYACTNLLPGTYSVAETVPAGWTLTSSGCTDGTPASITLDPGETVTCTFNNTKQGKIIIQKVCNPAGDSQSFTFTRSYAANVNVGCGGSNDSGFLNPGTYIVGETVPLGWTLTPAPTCSDGSPPGSISLGAGETVTCTFTNVKLGKIIAKKTTNPSGDPTSFAVTLTGPTPGAGPITDATDQTFDNRTPGAYTLSETVPVGWQSTGVTCDNASASGSPSVSFTLNPGQTVNCTFTNLKPAKLTVCKDVIPNDATVWDFQLTGPTPGGFNDIPDGGCHTFLNLLPGAYMVSESFQIGYQPSVDCGPGPVAGTSTTVTLAAGGDVTCQFVNAFHPGENPVGGITTLLGSRTAPHPTQIRKALAD